MQPATAEDQARYQRIVSTMAQETSDSTNPTDLLRKVAAKEDLTPPEITLVANVYNKSLGEHRLSKGASYEVADPVQVLHERCAESLSDASYTMPAFVLPIVHERRPVKASTLALQKTAADEKPATTYIPRLVFRDVEELKRSANRHIEALEKQAAEAKYEFTRALDRVPPIWMRENAKSLRKVAQDVVNAYPITGPKLVELVRAKASWLPLPVGLEKTASAAVLKPIPAYTCVTHVHEAAEKLQMANARLALSKVAIGPVLDFGSNLLAGLVNSTNVGPFKETASDRTSVLRDAWNSPDNTFKVDDPDIDNALSELKARQAFYNIVLSDDSLLQYSLPELANSFNEALSTVPEALSNPKLLRQLMLTNLESGGRKDIFQLQQEAGLAKTLKEAEVLRGRDKERREDRDEKRDLQKTESKAQDTRAAKERDARSSLSAAERTSREKLTDKQLEAQGKEGGANRTSAQRLAEFNTRAKEILENRAMSERSRLEGAKLSSTERIEADRLTQAQDLAAQRAMTDLDAARRAAQVNRILSNSRLAEAPIDQFTIDQQYI